MKLQPSPQTHRLVAQALGRLQHKEWHTSRDERTARARAWAALQQELNRPLIGEHEVAAKVMRRMRKEAQPIDSKGTSEGAPLAGSATCLVPAEPGYHPAVVHMRVGEENLVHRRRWQWILRRACRREAVVEKELHTPCFHEKAQAPYLLRPP